MSREKYLKEVNRGIAERSAEWTSESVIAAMLMQISETLAIIADNTMSETKVEEEGETSHE